MGCTWKMGRQIPPNLISYFTRALKTFQLSKSNFGVLCTLPSASPEPAAQPPRSPPRSLLVLDSSFNPPTLAHQRMALSALREERYAGDSRVLLLLAVNNADKAPKPAAFPQRLAMMYVFALDLVAALQRDDGGGRPAVDLAVTTEPYFSSKSDAVAGSDFYGGGHAGVEQVYLTGFDTLIRIFDPKYYPDRSMGRALEPLFSHSRLRITMRTDADWGDAAEQVAYLDNLKHGRLDEIGGKKEWADKVEMVQGRQQGEEVISSTKVRDAVQDEDWDRLRELVSNRVTEWVRQEGLYGGED